MQIEQYKEILDYAIIGILGLMGFLALFFSIERMLSYKSVKLEQYVNKKELELFLQKNLTYIATIGSNAPYVGLLGTVIGIMITFYTLGDVGTVDAKRIMIGLALALKATAMGLVVAMPAIVAYTITLRKVERILTKFDVAQEDKTE